MRVSLIFLLPLLLAAQGAEGITGKIIDINGAGLPGVNVMVKGTYYGAASDLEGHYRIDKINPGSYDVEVSMIGYKVILKTGNLSNYPIDGNNPYERGYDPIIAQGCSFPYNTGYKP